MTWRRLAIKVPEFLEKMTAVRANEALVSRWSQPIRGQYPGHVITPDQSEANVVSWWTCVITDSRHSKFHSQRLIPQFFGIPRQKESVTERVKLKCQNVTRIGTWTMEATIVKAKLCNLQTKEIESNTGMLYGNVNYSERHTNKKELIDFYYFLLIKCPILEPN